MQLIISENVQTLITLIKLNKLNNNTKINNYEEYNHLLNKSDQFKRKPDNK